ncbi:porin [Sulfurisoma sediminicola]|uniref:Putative porin n=1 Tax=Sulfurisoma sediminicola TaxID=1381557 RepID=A0A497XK44_9PROT|nr:porin [Sulfurisoma sediminicola]RLJ67745.1 putative porin [Sulfurisoma sediminicola]
MQKKIIALAVAAVASGAAFAQSNVTISGNLNYQWENISGSNPTMANLAGFANQAAREGRNRVNENASELKFSVTEDLGNGLKAMAVIASGVQPTETISTAGTAVGGGTGSRGGLGGRDTYLGLSGNFGTVVAGRLSVHYNSAGKVDNFHEGTGVAASTMGILGGVGGATGTNTQGYGIGAGGRLGSTVAYVTPTFSGFNATVGYARPNVSGATPDGVTEQPTAAGSTTARKESGWTVKANFDNGPITAFASYLAHSDVTAAANVVWQNTANTALTSMTAAAIVGAGGSTAYSREVRGFRTGAAYTFGNGFKVGLIYDNTKTLWRDDSGNANSQDDDLNLKRTVWAVPVSFVSGPHTVGGTYARAGNLDAGGTLSTAAMNAGLADVSQTGATYWMLGYQYAFSKRTNVSATYARMDNDSRANYDFWTNGQMNVANTAPTTLANTRGSDPTTVQIGIKHSF